jgi:hypothetical protein
VSDPSPGSLSGCTWTCTASAGGSCQSANGSQQHRDHDQLGRRKRGHRDLRRHLQLSAGATVSLANTASVSYANDPVAGNNTATDTDTNRAAGQTWRSPRTTASPP